jgi:hypothetical protein
MNAAEQLEYYSAHIETLFGLQDACYSEGLSISFPNDYGFNLARKILGDLKAKVDAYGDKAYGLTEKQIAVIENAIKENRAGFDQRFADAKSIEDAKIVKEMRAINNGMDFDTSLGLPDDLYRAARFVVRKEKTRFEAKLWLAEERAYQDLRTSQSELFGLDDGGYSYRHSTNYTIYAKYEFLKMMWDIVDGKAAS